MPHYSVAMTEIIEYLVPVIADNAEQAAELGEKLLTDSADRDKWVVDCRARECEGVNLEPTPPTTFTFTRWRHGGWYVAETRWPNGGCGCVSNNYTDKKWRIACDPRPFAEQPTFKTRVEAALAEWHFVRTLPN